MAGKTARGPAGAAEEARLEAEVEGLEGQLEAARRKQAEADRGLAALSPRRREISVAVVSGDPEAQEELRGLARRRAELEMGREAAGDARERLGRMLEGARGRLSKAREEVHLARHGELSRRSEALNPGREELAGRLREVLERQASPCTPTRAKS